MTQSALEIESEAEGHRRGVAETVAEIALAVRAAGITAHWTTAGESGHRPACGQRGKCFTWADGEQLFEQYDFPTCRKCEVIWGNQEIL